mgnify:CR=1 FL=1
MVVRGCPLGTVQDRCEWHARGTPTTGAAARSWRRGYYRPLGVGLIAPRAETMHPGPVLTMRRPDLHDFTGAVLHLTGRLQK